MSWLSKFLHPEEGYKKAQEQQEKYYNEAQGQLNPYNQNGQQAFQPTFNAMQSLLNPAQLQADWIKSYEESPQAKQAQGLAQEHGLNSASALGLMGSTPALQALQGGASQISLNDRQNYLNDLMQKYLAGAGIGQNFYNTGAGAAGQQSQNAMNMGTNSGQNAYGQQNAQGNLFGNIVGTGLGVGAGALGGPLGGALANRFIGSYQPWSTGGH